MRIPRAELYSRLRKEFPVFYYEGYSYTLKGSDLHIVFDFSLSRRYFFRPEHIVSLPKDFDAEKLSDSLFRNIVFNLGMVESISYWKAACPPGLLVNAGGLDAEQAAWWEKLFRHGLGEFFHTNGIIPGEDFIRIEASGASPDTPSSVSFDRERILVPVGGGKDSVVSLELLSDEWDCVPFIINPRTASMESALRAGYSEGDILTSSRSIDPELLLLNEKGFLNGHTPFSAMLAFTSLLIAYLHDIPMIALSNESSANEPSIPGTDINHQYSKSMEFENDFRQYVRDHISPDIHYFSLLRPLNELQIAGLFSRYSGHFGSFKSCNVGSREDRWCCQCPKCLFTFIMLHPFLGSKELISIFGKDLFNEPTLIPLLEQLSGLAPEKPFECVGTLNEVRAALEESINRNKGPLPALLNHYKKMQDTAGESLSFPHLLQEFGPENIPDKKMVNTLKMALHVF